MHTVAANIHAVPRAHRLPVLRALIGIEEMRYAAINDAGEWVTVGTPAFDELFRKAVDCSLRLSQLRELETLIREARATSHT